MYNTTNVSRPCEISESIIRSCKEVKSMRNGQAPKRKLEDLFAKMEKWVEEEKATCTK